MTDIFKYITTNSGSYDDIYCKAIQLYNKDIVDFLMYDLYGYIGDDFHNSHNLTMQKNRIGQQEYRNALIERYKKCMITGDNIKMCEACHIVPYSICKNYQVDNGLLLTSSLHKLFDDYQMTINANTHRVMISNVSEHTNYEKYNGMLVVGISNKTSDYLSKHNEKYSLFLG